MSNIKCPECGNPNVNLVWFDGFWTGKCRLCGTIVNTTKEEVTF